MSTLRFSDSMEFDLTGPTRIEERWDGLYVIGEGMLIAVESEEEASKFLTRG
jgi:hypothetical protein